MSASRVDTSNDALLAQALAEQEGNAQAPAAAAAAANSRPKTTLKNWFTAPAARQRQYPLQSRNGIENCPGKHGLKVSEITGNQRAVCNSCHKVVSSGNHMYACLRCDYDVCANCVSPAVAIGSAGVSSSPPNTSRSDQSSSLRQSMSHMCHLPCVMGENGICVEMMVDTGAQSSVMSSTLAQELGLSVERAYGVASGVGTARITGIARNVPCRFNGELMEFAMDFMILELGRAERLLLLGLDQMRKYKCLVDLERNVLIFGGSGGLEVPMLEPPPQPSSVFRNPYEFRDPVECTLS